ncbi:glycosyltransferase [Roseomonas rosulenta]|uniref:glycosyltransferase n=1 Tax=Roseomonas rosulenta TaxID=2748667 RepID=UPI0018E03B0B|nr:glycosyltransferase [Roseomonas rosulenta]
MERTRSRRKTRRARLLVDLTSSLALADEPHSDVARVEGEIAGRLLGSRGLNALPVVLHTGTLYALDAEQRDRVLAAMLRSGTEEVHLRIRPGSLGTEAEHGTATMGEDPPALPVRLAVALMGSITRAARRAARGSLAVMPNTVREDVRAILIHARQIVRTAVYRAPLVRSEQTDMFETVSGPAVAPPRASLHNQISSKLTVKVHARHGDVIWTAGAGSGLVPLRDLAALRDSTGLRVVGLSGNLARLPVPTQPPRSGPADTVAAITVDLLDTADLVLVPNNWSWHALTNFAERTGRRLPPIARISINGAGTAQSSLQQQVSERSAAGERIQLPPELAAHPFALAIGPVDAPGNHRLLVRVWEQLIAHLPTFPLNLVILGRLGVEAEDSIVAIEASPLFGTRILWVDRWPDAAQGKLLEACHVVLYPCRADGWGMAVMAALASGRAVIASNTGAIPEAAQGLARLVDPDDEAGWAAAITDAATAPRCDRMAFVEPNWDTATAGVESQLRSLLCLSSGVAG